MDTQTTQPDSLLRWMASLADATRLRLLRLVERHELAVSDLCDVLQLPQSTVSRHLKTLADGGWVSSRPEGTRRLYTFNLGDMDASAQQLWPLAGAQIGSSATARQDRKRLNSVLKKRSSRTREFFDTAAGQWDRKRDELFGNTFYLFALLAIVERVQLVWRALRTWWRARNTGLREVIFEHRHDVVRSVVEAL